ADDLGYVDFTRLAFRIFGVHVRSFYYMFFLLYGLSLFLALFERRHDRLGQGLLVSIVALIYATCFYSNLMFPEPPGLGNMLNPRFMSVIGFIPMVHLVLVAPDRELATAPRVAIVVFQSAMVFFAAHIRASGVWLVAAFAISVAVHFFLAVRRETVSAAVRNVLPGRWPAIADLAVVFLGLQSVSLSLHPIYRQQGWLQHHAFWHSVYYSLMYHPKYLERFNEMHERAEGDAMPMQAAVAYLRAHPDE